MALKLRDRGHQVLTLTNSPNRPNPFRGQIDVHPYNFERPERLTESLRGVHVLYNTYWVRFNHTGFTHAQAVRNTNTLFACARDAGVERIVHVSITNPSLDSPLEYFRGKAELERSLIGSGVSYAILRPAVLFGGEDILINNIAWILRRFPIFGVFGAGNYRLQPIFVEDFADVALRLGESRENAVVDAIGPETFTFRELVAAIGSIIGAPRPIIAVPPTIGFWAARTLGMFVGDVVLTREEIQGLMDDLLVTTSPPAGATSLLEWARNHATTLGARYASELQRRSDRSSPYST